MITFLFFLLVLIGLPLWLWLASRISQVNNTGALLSMLLVFPAFYWTYKLWHNRRADLRKAAIANLVVNLIALPALVVYSAHYATSQALAASVPKDNPQMTRWCRENSDAIYDPVMGVCVEPSKVDALAQEQHDNLMGQFEQYLNQHGYAGELDRNATPEIAAQKAKPDIADAAGYRFSGATGSSAPALLMLCLSDASCAKAAAKAERDGTDHAFPRGHLLLLVHPDSFDDASLKKLKAVVAGFKPA